MKWRNVAINTIIFLCGAGAAHAYHELSKEHTVLTAVDETLGVSGRVVWSYDMLPLNTVRADLLIEPFGASTIPMRIPLLKNEDCEQDVQREFPRLQMRNGTIKVDCIRKKYFGPVEFNYEGVRPSQLTKP